MAAEIELDRDTVRPEQLQAVVGGVINSGDRILHHDDARGDVAAGIAWCMKQRRKYFGDVEPCPHHDFLRRNVGHDLRRKRTTKGALHEVANAPEIQTEAGFTVFLRT